MCFQNDKTQLDKFRARKRPITVWKMGYINSKTGLTTTRYGSARVEWKLGAKIRPDRIRSPLTHGDRCSSGLYFYTNSGKVVLVERGHVRAKVDPKDIIAISDDGKLLCCVKATVTKAVNPDPKLMRIRWLKRCIRSAQEEQTDHRNLVKEWEQGQEERMDVLQNMKDEIKGLSK